MQIQTELASVRESLRITTTTVTEHLETIRTKTLQCESQAREVIRLTTLVQTLQNQSAHLEADRKKV